MMNRAELTMESLKLVNGGFYLNILNSTDHESDIELLRPRKHDTFELSTQDPKAK